MEVVGRRKFCVLFKVFFGKYIYKGNVVIKIYYCIYFEIVLKFVIKCVLLCYGFYFCLFWLLFLSVVVNGEDILIVVKKIFLKLYDRIVICNVV